MINTQLIVKKITEKTKAIIPVHLYGNVCDMSVISQIAGKNKIKIIEDCAQSHGSLYKGKQVPYTEIGCFSFFPAKNLGAFGDAGAIATSDSELAKKCRMFVNHGRADKYLHEIEGFNFRLDNLQAAILNVKLKYLNEWTDKKRKIAEKYNNELKNKIEILDNDIKNSSYHLFVVKTDKRDKLKEHLEKYGIQTGIHYPIPLHLQPAFSYLGYKKGNFPVAEMLAEKILSIPLYPELKDEEINKIIEAVKSFN